MSRASFSRKCELLKQYDKINITNTKQIHTNGVLIFDKQF